MEKSQCVIKWKEKEHLNFLMEGAIKEILRIMNKMGLENSHGRMEKYIGDSQEC